MDKIMHEMRLLKTIIRRINPSNCGVSKQLNFNGFSTAVPAAADENPPKLETEFSKLDLVQQQDRNRRSPFKKRERKDVPPPRYKKMPVNQDWASVWPVPRSFHPASVPLPIHQGYVKPGKLVPGKFANLELMKIPNFLHLTPPAISRHCEAIKKFCTPWPEELKTDQLIEEAFPLEVINTDYCHSIPSIRDVRSRIVTIRIKLSSLELDEHSRDKFLRLVGDRYNRETDILTILTDSCPFKKQNFDYAMYLLTALYQESWTKEIWEDEKEIEDMEKFVWEGSAAQNRLTDILKEINSSATKPNYLANVQESQIQKESLSSIDVVNDYAGAIAKLHNEDENLETLENYGKNVRNLFNLPKSLSS